MKKFSFMALALGLFLAAGNAMAAGAPSWLQDSTWLANNNVMSKTVGQPNSGSALGSVIVWTNAGMPADAVNWRECNGQSLAGTEVCKRIGICAAPDYRGFFLCGLGGNSAGIGQKQEDAIRRPDQKSTLSTRYYVFDGATGAFSRTGDQGRTYVNNDFGDLTRSLTFDISKAWSASHQANEFRPTNKGVRYLIKVN